MEPNTSNSGKAINVEPTGQSVAGPIRLMQDPLAACAELPDAGTAECRFPFISYPPTV